MRLNKIPLLVISIIIAYILHITVSSNILGNMIFFLNPIINSAVYLTFLLLQIIIVYMLLNYVIRVLQTNSWQLLPREIKILRTMYILTTILALYGRGLFTTRTSFSFDITTIFAMGSNIAVITFVFNLLWFIPFGLFTNWSFKKTFSLFIFLELIQVVLQCGIFDINDLILYSVGFFVGRIMKYLFQH